jgi:predicted dehydrogenase
MNIGIIGCGNISTAYLEAGKRFTNLNFAAVADLDVARARAQAEKFGIAAAESPGDLLADSSIDVILNLTIPAAHVTVGCAAVEAGKHVYSEKPIAISYEEASRLLDVAKAADKRVGSAPDTFLGASGQTARRLIDEGVIGTPVAATAFMTSRGMEQWHPNPENFYLNGGGPMLDMGPYYLTSLVNLLGPAQRVCGMTRRSFETRRVTAPGVEERDFPVETPTHHTGVIDFANGAIATVMMSFDIHSSTLPRIEVYGSEGTLFIPDPNNFGDDVFVQIGGGEREKVVSQHSYGENSRSVGLADMVDAIERGRPHRCSGELAVHVLEVMLAFEKSSDAGAFVELETSVKRPAAMVAGLVDGEIG